MTEPTKPPHRFRASKHRIMQYAKTEGIPRPEIEAMIANLTGGGSRAAWQAALRDVYGENEPDNAVA